jgi:IS5 family transposase
MTLSPAPVAGDRRVQPVRLMAGPRLKHAHNLSDEDTCRRWLENPYWQFSTGEVFLWTTLLCDPSSLVHWRQRLGEAITARNLDCAIMDSRSRRRP